MNGDASIVGLMRSRQGGKQRRRKCDRGTGQQAGRRNGGFGDRGEVEVRTLGATPVIERDAGQGGATSCGLGTAEKGDAICGQRAGKHDVGGMAEDR
ncbi:hypothetical protein M0R45_030929 [Rubus argutus]|uniref:Uncharacterized protein n=1 Tax=Rubus argutus TaxID=59490 RepID=A0AAW1WF28_RUBAR